MADLIDALFRVDPTDGLVEYTKSVKPYHSKILDVLVEYVYSESMSVSLSDRYSFLFDLSRPDVTTSYADGYGYRWSSYGVTSPESTREVIILSAHSTYEQLVTAPVGATTFSFQGAAITTFLLNERVQLISTRSLPVFNSGVYNPGGILYIKSVTSSGVTLSKTVGGPAEVIATANLGELRVKLLDRPVNSFKVQLPTPTSYRCIAINTESNQFAFVQSVGITAVNPFNRTWRIPGNATVGALQLTAGDIIYVNGNTTTAANGRYTVQSAVYDSFISSTVVTVNEPISLIAGANGSLNKPNKFDDVPFWPSNCAVKLTTSGSYPNPVSPTAVYYFCPTEQVGIFNLAYRRNPQKYTDYVNITNLGSGVLFINKAEPFSPGEAVKVDSTFSGTNNGHYTVAESYVKGSDTYVRVLERIPKSSPPSLLRDGVMRLSLGAFDYPVYTYVANASDIHSDAFVHERLTFEFVVDINDKIGTSAEELDTEGWGNAQYDVTDFSSESDTPEVERYSTFASAEDASVHPILPSGFDTHSFDIGGMDDNLQTLSKKFFQ